jgi:serine/threonine protein kinase
VSFDLIHKTYSASISTHFNRKCVKKFIQELPRAYKPSDLIRVLKDCEADRLSELEHENIVKYYEFFIEKNHVCIVLEYCDVNSSSFKY